MNAPDVATICKCDGSTMITHLTFAINQTPSELTILLMYREKCKENRIKLNKKKNKYEIIKRKKKYIIVQAQHKSCIMQEHFLLRTSSQTVLDNTMA